ncbi:MAG: HEPN domain-containing protein [Planctomycetales bacterium]|nr:HEPN domain-containing protein [Planctomycetales bacterium]
MAKDHFSGVTEQGKASVHRLEDAKSLVQKKRWRGAMYLAGYAVECLLKKQLMLKNGCFTLRELEEALKTKRQIASSASVFTHQIEPLFKLAGGLDRLRQNDKEWLHFNRVNEWMPAWRYAATHTTREEAEDFIESVESLVKWIAANVG